MEDVTAVKLQTMSVPMSDSLWMCRMEGQIEEGDLVRLRGKWQETMAKIHGASPAPRAAPEYAHMPRKACQPSDALCAETIPCVTGLVVHC